MASITLKGREIPLLYTTYEMKQIQEEVAPFTKAVAMLLGRNPEDEDDTSRFGSAEHLEAIGKILRILGNAGLEEAGEKADLTEMLRRLRKTRPAMKIPAPARTKSPVTVPVQTKTTSRKIYLPAADRKTLMLREKPAQAMIRKRPDTTPMQTRKTPEMIPQTQQSPQIHQIRRKQQT